MLDNDGRRKRGDEWRLSHAYEVGHLVRIRCGLCNTRRWFEPTDLIKLLGYIDTDDIAGKLFSKRCGRKDYTAAESHHLSAQERMGIRVRRLAEIKMVRRLIWQDE